MSDTTIDPDEGVDDIVVDEDAPTGPTLDRPSHRDDPDEDFDPAEWAMGGDDA